MEMSVVNINFWLHCILQYMYSRAAAGQMGALSRIVLLCPPPSNIMEVKKKHLQNWTLIKYKNKLIN